MSVFPFRASAAGPYVAFLKGDISFHLESKIDNGLCQENIPLVPLAYFQFQSCLTLELSWF